MEISHFWEENGATLYHLVKQEKRKSIEIARTSLWCRSATDKWNNLCTSGKMQLLNKKNMVANSVPFGCVIDLVLFAVQRETKFICCNRVEIHRFKPWRGNVVCPPMQHKSERYVANPSCTIHWRHYWNFRAMNFPFLYCFCFLSWDQQARLKIDLSRP